MDDITKAIHGARAAQIDRIRKGMSNAAEVLSPEGEIKKAQEVDEQEKDIELFLKACGDSEEDIEKEKGEDAEEEEKDVKKSDIAEALSRGDIKIKKTGKEIKEQISNIIMPDLTAKLAAKETEATNLLKECGNAPTKDACSWWTDDIKMDCGYKVYDWNETYFEENRDQRFMPTFTAEDEAAKKGNKPVDRAQAEARMNYNNAVRAICAIKVDIKTCEVMTANLTDGTNYELSARQAIVLRF